MEQTGKRRTRTLGGAVLAGLMGLGLVAPVTGCNNIAHGIQCERICDSYKTCIDGALDKRVCQERCFDAVDGSDDLQSDADECANCMEKKACLEISVLCTTCPAIYETFRPDTSMGGAGS